MTPSPESLKKVEDLINHTCQLTCQLTCSLKKRIAQSLDESRREVLYSKEMNNLSDILNNFKRSYDAFSGRQHYLLVKSQDLGSASKNWDAFPEAFSFDLEPLFQALIALKKLRGEKY